MGAFAVKRILKGLVIVWFIWTLVFVLVRVTGDPVDWMLSDGATVQEEEELRASLHLDQPILSQYVSSLGDLLRGDWGRSYFYKRPVTALYAERASYTLRLSLPAFVISIALGIAMGIVAACNKDSAIDRATMSFTVAGSAIPNFVLGILMVFLFSLKLRWLPSGSTGGWKNYVMPSIALIVGPMASIARLTRSALLDTMRKEYLDGARMKGIGEFPILIRHAVRNSLIPVVTSIGMQLGHIIGGAVTVEAVFGWPGIGTLISKAATQRDFPTVQFGILIVAASVTLASVLVDISYGMLDPRIRENYK